MKHVIVIFTSTVALALSQAANAQYASGSSPGMGDWEFRIGPMFMNSQNVDFKGGTTANIKSNTGIKGGAAYYITDNLALGGNFSYSKGDFSATVIGGAGQPSHFENGRLEYSTFMFDATYHFGEGPFRPYVEAGLGYDWINTNIAAGPPQVGCWWDPWWGYICNGYQATHGNSSFVGQLGVGLQFNFSREFGLSAGYKENWIKISNAANNTTGFGGIEVLFNWRFTGS
jgi:outer membrane protein W